MGDIFVYILKSSLCLAVFYLFFMVALSRETLYRFNRIIIVVLFFLSLALPFVNISIGSETPYSGVALNLESLLAMASINSEDSEALSKIDSFLVWILAGYLFGVIIAFVRAVISFAQMIKMFRIRDSRRKIIQDGITLIIHNKNRAPFSWMNYIVISNKDYTESGEEIIIHELAHTSNYHSFDLLLAEAVKIIHWFNPAAYLLKRELQNIHEYQADEAVINQGIDATKYQLLLIKKAVGDRLYSMSNSFNQSKLKNRITMITKKKSQKRAALKALFLVPLSMFAVAAFATEEVSAVLDPVSELKVTDFIQKDTTKVIVKKELKVITFTPKSGDSINAIFFVDGVEKDSKTIDKIDPKDIKEVRVFKGQEAVEQYGSKAKEGIILITTKNDNSTEKVKSEEAIVIKMPVNQTDLLYVIDGVVQEKVILQEIDPKTIDAISILKGEAATKEYGDKGKNGVILITLKK